MKIRERIKAWWRSKTAAEKLLMVVSCVSTAAAVTGAVCAIRTEHSLDNVKIDVNLYPGGKDDPNPIRLKNMDDVDFTEPVPSPADNGSYDPYELAKDVYNTLEQHYEEGDPEKLEKALETSLQLAWDLAAREGILERVEENSEIPMQVHD